MRSALVFSPAGANFFVFFFLGLLISASDSEDDLLQQDYKNNTQRECPGKHELESRSTPKVAKRSCGGDRQRPDESQSPSSEPIKSETVSDFGAVKVEPAREEVEQLASGAGANPPRDPQGAEEYPKLMQKNDEVSNLLTPEHFSSETVGFPP